LLLLLMLLPPPPQWIVLGASWDSAKRPISAFMPLCRFQLADRLAPGALVAQPSPSATLDSAIVNPNRALGLAVSAFGMYGLGSKQQELLLL
jgi:hypothetical protein